MKTKLIRFALVSSLALTASALRAQDNGPTNSAAATSSNAQSGIAQKASADDSAKTSREFRVATQVRLEVARETSRQARAAKEQAQLQAARTQIDQIWAGLAPAPGVATNSSKPPRPPQQLRIVEDPKNQAREDFAAEAKGPGTK